MRSKIAVLLILFSILFFSVSDFVFAQASCPVPPPTLSRGSRGDCVRFLQQSLNTLIGSGLVVDGIFGQLTQDAVVDYQQLNNLRVDGIVGTQTWNSISQELYGQPAQPQTRQLPGYNLPPLPGGTGLTEVDIQGLLVRFANFLIAAGVILAIITIVVSGIMYFKAGSDTEAKSAKGWFRNGIIGAFIILAVGVIILTIYNIVVNRSFFGGTGVLPGPGGGTVSTGLPAGSDCQNDSQCASELICNAQTNICRRLSGNTQGEGCGNNFDCASGLECRGGLFGRNRTCQEP